MLELDNLHSVDKRITHAVNTLISQNGIMDWDDILYQESQDGGTMTSKELLKIQKTGIDKAISLMGNIFIECIAAAGISSKDTAISKIKDWVCNDIPKVWATRDTGASILVEKLSTVTSVKQLEKSTPSQHPELVGEAIQRYAKSISSDNEVLTAIMKTVYYVLDVAVSNSENISVEIEERYGEESTEYESADKLYTEAQEFISDYVGREISAGIQMILK